jgi:hypothetical protein
MAISDFIDNVNLLTGAETAAGNNHPLESARWLISHPLESTNRLISQLHESTNRLIFTLQF